MKFNPALCLCMALLCEPVMASPAAATAEPAVLSPGKNMPDIAAIDRQYILRVADAAMRMSPITITTVSAKLSSGGPNDFYSNGDYWWPNPSTPDGLPYVNRDGQTNPENFNHHRLAVRQLRDAVAALASANQITGDERYAVKAAQLLQVFFVDPATRMNPHLQYAQAIPGVSPGRGIGIIDTLHMIEIPQAVMALQNTKAFPAKTRDGVQQWFRDYLAWLITSMNGRDEATSQNNHSVAFWLQVAVFARYTDDQTLLAEARRQYKENFVPKQMALDGSFPLELKRTKPYAYSIFQLDNMSALCQVLSTPDDDLWQFALPDGRGIKRAASYLYPYLADKLTWPLKPDVQAWDGWPARQPALLFAGRAFASQHYLALWTRLRPDPVDEEVQRNIAITQPLLWLN